MRSNQLIRAYSMLLLLGPVVVGCSGNPETGTDDEGAAGTAILALAQTPSDVACLNVTATGSARAVTRSFDLRPGTTTSLTLAGLPVGQVDFEVLAYSVGCSQVDASAEPAWLSDPATALLSSRQTTTVTIAMRRNGRANVSVDFADEPGAAIERLDFSDGLLPSAYGWVFDGRGVAETAAASVSSGVLRIDTSSLPASDDLAWWRKDVAALGDHYVEASMRSPTLKSAFSGCTGYFGGGFGSSLVGDGSGMQLFIDSAQAVLLGPGSNICSYLARVATNGDSFHVYRAESIGATVRLLIDGVVVLEGPRTYSYPAGEAPSLGFGDGTTSGGDAVLEIDYIEAGPL